MKVFRSFLLVILFIATFQVTAFSQTKSSSTDQFFTYFSDSYIELSRPPLNNYMVNLNNTIKVSFITENPYFVPALKEISARYKVSEAIAADSLYSISLRKLLDQKLWINYTELYNENALAFKAYTEALCPCISSNFSDTSSLEKMGSVMQRCVGGLSTDTTALNNVRKNAGDKTLNDIFRNQKYFSLYMYQHCDVLKKAFSQTLRSEAYTNYISEVSVEKGNRGAQIINYYRDKKMDSLAVIFPAYKKFTKELNEVLLLLNNKEINMAAYAFSDGEGRNAIVSLYTNTASMGELMVNFANEEMNAPVTKITYTKIEPSAKGDKIEVKEDVAVPVKQ